MTQETARPSAAGDDAGALVDADEELLEVVGEQVALGVVLRGVTQHALPRTTALGRGLQALTAPAPPAQPGRRTRQRGRGLAALIPAGDTPDDDRVVIEPGAGPAVVTTAPAARERRGAVEGRRQLEAYWLITPTTPLLHHAGLSDAQAAELAEHEWVDHDERAEPIDLTCGRTAWAVVRPNAVERRSTPRCEQCCQALGYPTGFGGPVNATACTAVLGERLQRLALAEPAHQLGQQMAPGERA